MFSRTDFTYDARRNLIRTSVSANGTVRKVADQSWDDQGRLVCAAVRMNLAAPPPPGATAACALGPAGSQGPDRITRNEYDAAGQLLRVEKAVGTPIRQDYAKFEYTPNGKRKAVIDANGNRAEMTFDGFDRQTRWTFPSNVPGVANAADYEEYGYDLIGNRTSLRKRDGSVLAYQYDNLNRVIRKLVPERPGLAAAQTRDVFYDYDARGLQTKARFDNLDGEGSTTWYDPFGRPVLSSLSWGGEVRYVSSLFDAGGNRTRLTHPDGAEFGYSYDALGRVTTIHDKASPTSLDDLIVRYGYKPEGMRHAAVRGAGLVGFSTVYYYDPLQRPEAIINDLPGAANDVSVNLAYNPASQITQRSVSNDAYAAPPAYNVTRGYQVNGLNQYTGTTHAGAPNWSYEYDPNGNLKRAVDPIGPDTTSYLYDVENRLVAASGAANATLAYDPLGRLVQVTSGSGAVTRFLYDGDRLIAEYDGLNELTRRYVHGAGADEPVAAYDNEEVGIANRRYMLSDERGSVTALVNANGSPATVNRYDPWGIPGEHNAGRFQYTGQAWIGALGLYYYKARFYSPYLGRFMQTDPIGYKDQLNLYTYVGNDPINLTDPTGLSTYDCSGGLGTGNCHRGIVLRTGDVVVTRRVSFTIREGEGFTIARPIQRGANGSLSGREMRNIVFRETRSLSGDAVNVARRNIAHAVMNGDEESGAQRPRTAPTTAASPAPGERTAYEASGRMVLRAHAERSLGYDPTRGATHFNMRSTDSTTNFQGARITTQSGPLDNSYPTTVLPSTGVYVNTYREPD